MLDRLLAFQLIDGTSLGDLVSATFLLGIVGNLVTAALILIAGLWVSSWASGRISAIGGRNAHLDVTLFSFLGNVVRYVILGFALLFVLNTFGVRTTSLVAVIGAAGLAIGLALQGTLSNVAAGVMLVFFRPIRVGDFVTAGNPPQMGSVRSITLNFTEIASLGNLQIIIPNSQVWGNIITNYTGYPLRRIEWIFSVAYGANLKAAETTILETIMADPRAMADPEPFLQVTNLGDFSVDFMARVWCAGGDAWGFQTDTVRRVKEALDAAGIEIPFPTRTVFAHGDAADAQAKTH